MIFPAAFWWDRRLFLKSYWYHEGKIWCRNFIKSTIWFHNREVIKKTESRVAFIFDFHASMNWGKNLTISHCFSRPISIWLWIGGIEPRMTLDWFSCRKIWSGRWSAQARNVGSQCWLSILDRWSIKAWMIIAGLCWLFILASKSLPMIGRESLPELSRWSFQFIKILILTIKFKI